MVKWWLLLIAGAGFLLAPGVINPMVVINGSTLIGLGLITWASLKLTKG
jgi:hypothetical protein